MSRNIFFLIVVAFASISSASPAQILVPTNSVWRYFKGQSEPSSPSSAWRTIFFNDTSWAQGEAPFYYDRGGTAYRGQTQLTDMYDNYTTLFLRRSFSVADPTEFGSLELRFFVDDGFAMWINGTLVTNLNTSTSNFAYNTTATRTVTEPLQWVTYTLVDPWRFLRAGTNVIAVQAFNRPATSSDFIVEMELRGLPRDSEPPRLASVTPQPGTLAELTSVTVTFSEPVRGIGFSDLLINGRPAQGISGGGSVWTFEFEDPAYGPVAISWDEGAAITDFASPANKFDHTAPSARWAYTLVDSVPPTIASINPPPSGTLQALSEIELWFSEPVRGLDASDLFLNNVAATNLSGSGRGPYKFSFPPPQPGPVQVGFAAPHGVEDENGNALNAMAWQYTVNPEFTYPPLVITEFLTATASGTGLRDEDDELSDWIEIHNPTGAPVNLAGWSLTDEEDEPGKWIFPNVTVPANARLVVFASGKDRKPTSAGSKLHTNFKLSPEGEYLGLFAPSSPRGGISVFQSYPEQRADFSFGYDAGRNLRYFAQPTPGAPNSSSSITGIAPPPAFSVQRGFFNAPFTLEISAPLIEAQIRFTRDGSEPTATEGEVYSGPLQISSNAVIRAAVFRPNYLPSRVATHTYLFPALVARQPVNPPGFPDVWIDTSSRTWQADYEMDPEIVDSPAYREEILHSLRALPVISLVTAPEDMFDNSTGIYPKSQARGPSWERPASAEFIFHKEGKAIQVNCGVQMQGNSVRDPVKTAKHSFRLVFKGDYGPSKLNAQIFPDSPVKEFDTLTLRADFNVSWMHWDGSQRPRAQRVRDAFTKDTQRAMSGLGAHNRYFHLYVNGLYWGIYDPTERPDAAFGQAYFGGSKADYDVVNEGQLVDGTMTAYNAMLAIGNLGENSQFELMKQYLDVTHYIDYMLLHFYIGHQDWGQNKNWYTLRRRAPGEGFKYLAWDGEMILDSPTFNRVTSTDSASGLHGKLMANAEYRLQFADRAHRHLFNEGALAPNPVADRFSRRLSQVESAMVAESARWGDYRRDVHRYSSSPYVLYTRNDHFYTERDRLLTQYFPGRTATLLGQLRSAGLYPSTAAPSFSKHGGRVAPGFSLTMSAPAGTIYYTTNGADPRVAYTGAIAADARVYSGAIQLSADAPVKARARNGTEWSALNEAVFTMGSLLPKLAISEIMYNPIGGSPYEFIEIYNYGSTPVDIGNYSFEGITYNFPPATVIDPGQVIVLAAEASPLSFAERYPGARVFGYFQDNLSNGGERIALLDGAFRTVASVVYRDRGGWPREADGGGRSLELRNVEGDPSASGNWMASPEIGGSPGIVAFSPEPASVRINELAAAEAGADWVELFNRSDAPADISNWRLSDSGSAWSITFPAGTVIPARAFLMAGAEHGTNAPALEANGESLFLWKADGQLADAVSFGPQARGYSLSRFDAGWALGTLTPGAPNSVQPVGQLRDLVLNEWLANSTNNGDFIEFYNRSALPLSLRGLHVEVNGRLAQLRSPAFIAPGALLAFYADEAGTSQSLDLKLPAEGGTIVLLDPLGAEFNRLQFGPQAEGQSGGRLPDGSGTIVTLANPSPGRSNTDLPESPEIRALRLDAGELRFNVRGQAGQSYTLESSANLNSWNAVASTNAPAGEFAWSVPVNSSARRQFYRVRASQ